MIINRVVKNELDGSVSAVLHLTEEQTKFLINFAIGFLVEQGTIKIFDLENKEGDVAGEAQQVAGDFLTQVDPTKIGQA